MNSVTLHARHDIGRTCGKNRCLEDFHEIISMPVVLMYKHRCGLPSLAPPKKSQKPEPIIHLICKAVPINARHPVRKTRERSPTPSIDVGHRLMVSGGDAKKEAL